MLHYKRAILHVQGNLLSQLEGAAHVIELLGKAQCVYNGATWDAILVAPFVQRLNNKDDVRLFGQVCCACLQRHNSYA